MSTEQIIGIIIGVMMILLSDVVARLIIKPGREQLATDVQQRSLMRVVLMCWVVGTLLIIINVMDMFSDNADQ